MENTSQLVAVLEDERLHNFSRLQQTKDFIKALENSMNTAKGSNVSVWKKAIIKISFRKKSTA